MTNYFEARDLLVPPIERAAFSDRQAYTCAELSKVAYFPFEGGHHLEKAMEVVRTVVADEDKVKQLEKALKPLLSRLPSSASDGEAALKLVLNAAGFELVKAFNKTGTQAFLCTRDISLVSGIKKIAYLVFRGTQPTDFSDIKTDINAALQPVEVGGETLEIHSGYLAAFELVKKDIQDALAKATNDQLILTGHSLGGALAIVATRMLASDSTGACYTFGAPPVGTIEIQNRLKTPVYEIINEIDIVPRLPNPWTTSAVVWLLHALRLLAKSVTILNTLLAKGTWDERLEAYVKSMTRYRHPGYVSYLVGTESNAHLRYNVDSFDRFRWWSRMMLKKGFGRFGKMFSDHSIDTYIAKLVAHARQRQ